METSRCFKIPEYIIDHALHDAPSFWENITGGNGKHIAEFQALLLAEAVKDNFVYCGLGGQYLLRDIDHALKVRITADIEPRVHEKIKRDSIPYQEAKNLIEKDDEQRRKWGFKLWGDDPWDSRLYDLVFHIGKLTCEHAAKTIVSTVSLPTFKTTAESRRKIKSRATAALIKAQLMAKFTVGSVSCHNETVEVALEEPMNERERIEPEVMNIIHSVEGVNDVTIRFVPFH
jgi:hypothetical protein